MQFEEILQIIKEIDRLADFSSDINVFTNNLYRLLNHRFSLTGIKLELQNNQEYLIGEPTGINRKYKLTPGGDFLGSICFYFFQEPKLEIQNIYDILIDYIDTHYLRLTTFNKLLRKNRMIEAIYRVNNLIDNQTGPQIPFASIFLEILSFTGARGAFFYDLTLQQPGLHLSKKLSQSQKYLILNLCKTISSESEQSEIEIKTTLPELGEVWLMRVSGNTGELYGFIGVTTPLNPEKTFPYWTGELLNAISGQLNTALNYDRKTRTLAGLFKKYVPEAVVDELMQSNNTDSFFKSNRFDLTVMFADIRGFTSMAEQHNPEEIVALLNKFFSIAVDCVMDYSGTLDKFIGDEVMAFFGAPLSSNSHGEQAARCAIELQLAVTADPELLPIGIGIATGNCLVGNIGCEKRTEYTAIGRTVNLAARLCSQAESGEILVSSQTAEKLIGIYNCIEIPDINIKGFSIPQSIYQLKYINPTNH